MLDLKVFLERESVEAQLLDLGHPMTTTAAAADRLGIEMAGVFKSLVLCTEQEEIVIAVLPGDKRVDFKRICQVMGCRKLSFARPEVALERTGYPPGGTPPIGWETPLRTVIDESIHDHEEIYCGGGRPELLLRIQPAELLRVSGAIAAPISL